MEQWNKLRNILSVNKLRVPPARNKGGTCGGIGGTRGVSVPVWEVFSPVLASSGRGCCSPGLLFAGVKAAFPDVFRASPVSGSGINRNAPGTGPGASWLAFLLVQKFSVFRTSRVILFLQVFFPYRITGKKVLFVRRPGIAGR